MKYDLGFIGCGNMGSALAAAASKSGAKIACADHNAHKLDLLSEKYGTVTITAEEAASESRFVILGVKPQVMAKAASEISSALAARTDSFTVVTMAGGLAISTFLKMLGGEYPIIRIMPNTPTAVGAGMTLYCTHGVSEAEESEFLRLMAGSGLFDKMAEPKIDAATAVSGSGPAFALMFIEALADGAVKCGLTYEKALKYAQQMLYGTAKLALESGKHPAELKNAVCSPGGSTIAGVKALEDGAFRAAAMAAVEATYIRTKEMGQEAK